MPINTSYQQFGIFISEEPNVSDLIQAQKVFHIKDILSLDRDSAKRVSKRIADISVDGSTLFNQTLFHISPTSPAGEASTLFNNIINYIPGTLQRPILIHCRAGKDRAGFAVASWLIKIKRRDPCMAIKEVEKTIGYGTGGISEVAKNSMDRILGCPPQNKETIETNQADDAVSYVKDLGYHAGTLTSTTSSDGGFWADNIGFMNQWIDPVMEKYPLPKQTARIRLLNRILKTADKLPGGFSDNSKKKFDPKQIEKGIEIEKEHTKDLELRKEITKDHLMENEEYYDYLEDMEKKMEEDKNDAFLGGGPSGSPYAEDLPLGLIPGYIEQVEKRRKRRAKLMKLLEKSKKQNPPTQSKGIADVGLGKTYDGGQLSNTLMTPSGAPGAANAASNSESAGYVQL